MAYNYSFQNYNKELMARAVGVLLPVSFKKSVEICNYIRKRNLQKAKQLLIDVKDFKRAIPYRRYNMNVPHKRGTGPGRYPIKTCDEFLGLLESVEANAQSKGLSTANLVISHIMVHKAGNVYHYGRSRGTKMKRSHIEVIVQEAKEDSKESKKIKKKVSGNKTDN